MLSTTERVAAYISDPDQITSEQRRAIVSESRITVVRACPGSGKTRAFAARFAWDIVSAATPRTGVAALSFTNVAEQEVRSRVRALNIPDGHPHFVGTIDAFLLRFVVRRFGGELVNLDRFSHPVADGDYTVQDQQLRYGPDARDFARLSTLRIAVDHQGLIRGERLTPDRKVIALAPEYFKDVVKAKKEAWQRGELTHSDVIAIALKLLRDDRVSRIVAGRFPRILVDEFQDTSGVRERCLRPLFASPRFERAFVVGDPDQCIMEFAGARPELFDEFEALPGAAPFTLTTCFRTHVGIVKVTSAFRDSVTPIDGRREVTASAETVLVTHRLKVRAAAADVARVATVFAEIRDARNIDNTHGIVLAWKDNDVARLGGMGRKDLPLVAPSFAHVLRALRDLACGRVLESFRTVEQLLAVITLKVARPPRRAELDAIGCDTRTWRIVTMRTVRRLADKIPNETVESWGKRVRQLVEEAAAELTGTAKSLGTRFPLKFETGTKNSKKAELLNSPVDSCLPDQGDNLTSTISKIHQVKGQEFRAVCLFIPADNQKAEPILVKAAPPTSDTLATRRVLYVGATRAQDLLVIALPETWVEELRKHEAGQAFIQSFDRQLSM